MSANLGITPVEPIGKRKAMAFVNRGHAEDGAPLNHSIDEIELDVYPEEAVIAGKALRAARVNGPVYIGPREAADRLGISITQLAAVEGGRLRCNREAWLEALGVSVLGAVGVIQ